MDNEKLVKDTLGVEIILAVDDSTKPVWYLPGTGSVVTALEYTRPLKGAPVPMAIGAVRRLVDWTKWTDLLLVQCDKSELDAVIAKVAEDIRKAHASA